MAADTNVTRQNGSDAITTICMAVAASANSIALVQAVAGAGAIVLNGALVVGGVYTSTGARRIVIVSTGASDTTQTITLIGTDRYGNALTEALALNGVTIVTSTQDFLTVTQVTASALLAGNITVGTSAVATGAWIEIDRVSTSPINIAMIARLVTGAANFGVEETFDDPNGTSNANQAGALFPRENDANGISVGGNFPAIAQDDATLAAKAATTQGSIAVPFWAYRLKLNSGTGTVQLQGLAALKPWHR